MRLLGRQHFTNDNIVIKMNMRTLKLATLGNFELVIDGHILQVPSTLNQNKLVNIWIMILVIKHLHMENVMFAVLQLVDLILNLLAF